MGLLLKMFQTSQDKTSKACQRRLRYILKNPQTRNNVNLYKGEALQDKVSLKSYFTLSLCQNAFRKNTIMP